MSTSMNKKASLAIKLIVDFERIHRKAHLEKFQREFNEKLAWHSISWWSQLSIRGEISIALSIHNLKSFTVDQILAKVRQYGEQSIENGKSINVSIDWITSQAQRIVQDLIIRELLMHFHLDVHERNAQDLRLEQYYLDLWFLPSKPINWYSSFNESRDCSGVITIDFEPVIGKTSLYLSVVRQKLEEYYFPIVLDEVFICDGRYKRCAIEMIARKFDGYKHPFVKLSWEFNLTTLSPYIPATSIRGRFTTLFKSNILSKHSFVKITEQVYQSTSSVWTQQISFRLWSARETIENLRRSISNREGIITLIISRMINVGVNFNINVLINALDVGNFAQRLGWLGRLIQYERNAQDLRPVLLVINQMDFVLVWKLSVFIGSNYSHKTLSLAASNELLCMGGIFMLDFIGAVYLNLLNLTRLLNLFNILLRTILLNLQENTEYSKPLPNGKWLPHSLGNVYSIFFGMNLINNVIMSISTYLNNANLNKSFSNSGTLGYSRKTGKAILVDTVLDELV